MWGRRETQGEQQVPGADTSADGAAVQAPASALDEKTQAFWHGKLAPETEAAPPLAAPAVIAGAGQPQAPRPPRANPVSTAFGDMASLLAKSPAHKHLSLADLEWFLLPPVALGQYDLADAKLPNGQTVLVGSGRPRC